MVSYNGEIPSVLSLQVNVHEHVYIVEALLLRFLIAYLDFFF